MTNFRSTNVAKGPGWQGLAVALALCSVAPTLAQIIPTNVTINWNPSLVGVPAGLSPTYSNGVPFRTAIWTNAVTAQCDPTGTTDCSAILNSLIAHCPSNQVVYLPTGNYLLTNCLNLGASYMTLRGAGMGQTVLIDGSTVSKLAVLILSGAQSLETYTNIAILGGYNCGSTNLLLSTNNFNYGGGLVFTPISVGMMIQVFQNDDSNFVHFLAGTPYWGAPSPYSNNLQQATMVTSVSGNKITIWPPLVWNFTNTFVPSIHFYHSPTLYGVGVEDLTITHSNAMTGLVGHAGESIFLCQAWGCWLRNVESACTPTYHFWCSDTVQCTVRDCYCHEASGYGPSQGVGLMFYNRCCSALVENNMFYRTFPAMEINGGSSGNVFDYNYSYEVLEAQPSGESSAQFMGDFDCNHGAHNLMNLWEGNSAAGFISDSYFGSCSHQTLFRNAFSATHPLTAYMLIGINLDVWSYNFNIVGNVLGSPPYTNLNGAVEWAPQSALYYDPTNSYGYGQPTVYRFGFPSLGNNYYLGCLSGGVCGVDNPAPSSWNANDNGPHDTLVQKTALLIDNYDYVNQAVVNPTNNLPASLFYTSQPGWWPTNVAWPPIGPDATPMAGPIPAQVRFVQNFKPVETQGSTQTPTQTPAPPANATFQLGSPPCLHILSSNAPTPYCPGTDPAVVEWLRADGSLNLIGSNVVTWMADIGQNANQSAATAYPIWLPNGQNGRPVVSFNGSSSFLRTAPFPTPLQQPFTIFIVYSWLTSPNSTSFVYDGIDTNRVALFNNNGFTPPSMVCVFYGAGSGTSTGVTTNSAWTIAEFQVTGASSTCSFNGGPQTLISSMQGSAPLDGFTLGARVDGSQFANVSIGEFIIVNGLASDTQAQIIAYLRSRWKTF